MKNKTIIITFSIGEGSVSDYFTELIKELVKEFKIIIISDKKHNNVNLLPKEVEVCYWPSIRPTKIKDFIFLYKLYKKKKPDMSISIFGSVNICLLVGFIFGIKNRIAWCRTLSTQFPQKKVNIIRKYIIYKFATKLITNSDATKKDLIDVFRVNKNEIIVLPNSVKNYNNCITPIDFLKDTIVYVGRLHESKGVDTLLHAVKILTDKKISVELNIIGTGPAYNNLHELVDYLKINKIVVFLGSKSKTEVLQYLKGAVAAIIPSKSEAFGFTVIEAMSVKTCVIGANNTGIKETIIDNETGLLFETDNPVHLASKIEFIINNKEKKDILSQKGYERFIAHYESSVAISRDIQFFKNLI